MCDASEPVIHPPTTGYGYPAPRSYSQPEGCSPASKYLPLSDPVVNQPTAVSGFPALDVTYTKAGMHPGDAAWMPCPTGIPVCPPGLEYLTMIDQLIVHKKVNFSEAFPGFETVNKYSIKNSMGQRIYATKEETDCCTRTCLGTLRPFDMKIENSVGNEVIHLSHPFRCKCCLCPCCLQKMEVMAPLDCLVGAVVQEWSICTSKFRVENASGETVLRIEGPVCTFSICGDVEFQILSKDGKEECGKITRQWAGLLSEMLTDADHFGITFPLDLDVNMKATLLGACMLIDFIYFEKQADEEADGSCCCCGGFGCTPPCYFCCDGDD